MNIKKIIGLVVIAVLLIMQFLVNKENVSSYESVETFEHEANLPDEVSKVFKESCYDCHSAHTKYPWYASIGVINPFIAHHIEEGREHLDFSSWQHYDQKRRLHKLAEVYEEVEEGEMPLKSYTILHGNLTEEQRNTILNWSKQFEEHH